MFISNSEKKRIENNIKFLIEEVAQLRIKINTLEGWERTKTTEKFNVSGNLYKWAKDHPQESKKRGRPVGSKNKVKA